MGAAWDRPQQLTSRTTVWFCQLQTVFAILCRLEFWNVFREYINATALLGEVFFH